MEQLDLSIPQSATISTYRPTAVHIVVPGGIVANATITIEVTDNLGNVVTNTYSSSTTPTAASLLHTLNTANFSGATTFYRALINRLTTDGFLPAGTISGTPA